MPDFVKRLTADFSADSKRHRYVIALGSNRRHPRLGRPSAILDAAFVALGKAPTTLVSTSKTIRSRPIGPSLRYYANAAALIETALAPDALLSHLKRLESDFGRRRSGQRWRARVLDLDIILWTGGIWADPDLVLPHRLFHTRAFVLHPVAMIAAHWRDPRSGLRIRHLKARLDRAGIRP